MYRESALLNRNSMLYARVEYLIRKRGIKMNGVRPVNYNFNKSRYEFIHRIYNKKVGVVLVFQSKNKKQYIIEHFKEHFYIDVE